MICLSKERLLAKQAAIEISNDLQRTFPNISADRECPIVSISYLLWAIEQVQENWEVWEIDKLHRWIGWVQGVLNACDLTKLDAEHDRIRRIKNDIKGQFFENFKHLAERWKEETASTPIASQKFDHPAYREIIGLGSDAIPLLLEELREKPNYYWFFALRKLTNADPVKPEHYGKLELMAQDWLEWAKENG